MHFKLSQIKPGFPQKHINKMGSSMNRHTLATALSNAADMLRGKCRFYFLHLFG